MADGKKLILGVGDIYVIKNLEDGFKNNGENEIIFGEKARSVTEAISEINSGNYRGVLLSSLNVRNGAEAKKYNIAAKKFEKFDNNPFSFHSSGLYVVEQACNKGLVVAVNVIAEETDALAEVERLGAKYFDKNKNFNDISGEILEYFQSHF